MGKGIEIIEALRGHTSGFAVPTYVIDAPGGGGKVPIAPQYLLSQSEGRVVVRNFEGYITTYTEPSDYRPHDAAHCPSCQDRNEEDGQEGIASLLAGDRVSIAPEGFDTIHQRLTRIRWRPIKKAIAEAEDD